MAPRSNSSARVPRSRLPCPCLCRVPWPLKLQLPQSRLPHRNPPRRHLPPRREPKGTEVTAPMVGVFYAAPAPGDEPFVRVGSKVKAGETLCIIEAMKVLNEVTAEADGEVLEICVADGDLVEFGSCLMRIG